MIDPTDLLHPSPAPHFGAMCVKFGKDADRKYFYTKHLKLLCSQSDFCEVSDVLDKSLPMKRSDVGAEDCF
jgi:hypothetical protein